MKLPLNPAQNENNAHPVSVYKQPQSGVVSGANGGNCLVANFAFARLDCPS
jgi:hypothetical protein